MITDEQNNAAQQSNMAGPQESAMMQAIFEETKGLIDLSRLAVVKTMTAGPQIPAVRKVLYDNFLACARIFLPEEGSTKQGD